MRSLREYSLDCRNLAFIFYNNLENKMNHLKCRAFWEFIMIDMLTYLPDKNTGLKTNTGLSKHRSKEYKYIYILTVYIIIKQLTYK